MLCVCGAIDKDKKMDKTCTICFTSDIHGYFSPVNYANGAPAATGLANCMSRFPHDGNTLIIDGGDTLQGSPLTYYLHTLGMQAHSLPARLMNLGGYAFVTLGNHDFNYGRSVLEQYLDELDAVCLCANVSGLPQVQKTAVVTLENGLRVGLTGITTQYINVWEKPENLRGITISEPLPAATAALHELKQQQVDLTVCIYHGGYENDLQSGALLSDTGENQACRLCRELDFDILLTGHQHMAVDNCCLYGSFTCQPPDKARSFIRMEVIADEGGVRAVSSLVPAGEETLPEAAAALAEVAHATEEWLDQPVGHLDVPLQPDTPIRMAANGSLIANFFNQVQLEASGAEISCTALGNEVRGFDRDVTIRDVVATYIYPNTLKTLEVDRAVLKAALERSAAYFALVDGELRVSDAFLKPKVEHYNYDFFSGIEVTYDLRRAVGERVVSIRYEGCELDDQRKLSLCMNNYRATGTGGYEVYTRCPILREQPNEIVEMIIDYIDRHRDITVDKSRYLTVLY